MEVSPLNLRIEIIYIWSAQKLNQANINLFSPGWPGTWWFRQVHCPTFHKWTEWIWPQGQGKERQEDRTLRSRYKFLQPRCVGTSKCVKSAANVSRVWLLHALYFFSCVAIKGCLFDVLSVLYAVNIRKFVSFQKGLSGENLLTVLRISSKWITTGEACPVPLFVWKFRLNVWSCAIVCFWIDCLLILRKFRRNAVNFIEDWIDLTNHSGPCLKYKSTSLSSVMHSVNLINFIIYLFIFLNLGKTCGGLQCFG